LAADLKFLTKDDIETDIEELGKNCLKDLMLLCRIRQDLTLIFEPGKFLVSEAGSFLVKVNVIKTNIYLFAGVDSGFNH
jgi:diaminopimelate decarboxylase